jgi:hypothetical protein
MLITPISIFPAFSVCFSSTDSPDTPKLSNSSKLKPNPASQFSNRTTSPKIT